MGRGRRGARAGSRMRCTRGEEAAGAKEEPEEAPELWCNPQPSCCSVLAVAAGDGGGSNRPAAARARRVLAICSLAD